MTRRFLRGELEPGVFGMRISRPNFDVVTEPFGSAGISFDTRLSDIGTVVSSGLVQCGGPAVPFPAMPYVPIVMINRFDGTGMYSVDVKKFVTSFGTVDNTIAHWWIPAIAIVTDSSIKVVPYTNPFFNTLQFFNPTGQWYAYSIFAAG